MHIAIWLLAALVLGLWSLVSWGLYLLLGLDASWLADVPARVAQWPWAVALETWLPGWQALLASLIALTQALLSGLGSAGAWIAGLVWAGGAFCIVAGAALLSGLVAVIRRGMRPSGPPGGAAPAGSQ